MGLYIYNPISHDQYYRVQRQVHGQYVERFFTRNDLVNAQQFDQHLAALQRGQRSEFVPRSSDKTHPNAVPALKAPKRTPVKGLQIGLQTQGYSHAPTRYYPCIVIAGSAKGKATKRTCRLITPTTRTLSQAWEASCHVLADYREQTCVPHHWLAAEPPPEQFLALVSHYRVNGQFIPDDALDYLFASAGNDQRGIAINTA